MKNFVVAILAAALAPSLAPALAAEDAEAQPTMAELAAKVDTLRTELAALAGTVGNLATAAVGPQAGSIVSKVDALASRGQEIAVVVTKASTTWAGGDVAGDLYLLGSSIPGFPSGTVADTGKGVAGNGRFTTTTLPAGTYLFELQNPTYSDNLVCHGKTSRGLWAGGGSARFVASCPRIWLRYVQPTNAAINERLDDGYGIYTSDGTARFWVRHKFPTGWTFTDARPAGSYTGAIKITKLK